MKKQINLRLPEDMVVELRNHPESQAVLLEKAWRYSNATQCHVIMCDSKPQWAIVGSLDKAKKITEVLKIGDSRKWEINSVEICK